MTVIGDEDRGGWPHNSLPLYDQGTSIPKVIRQTYFAKELPPDLDANIQGLLSANPGYTHVLYDDSDIEGFICENYGPAILGKYLRINPAYGAARADLFRYLLMYKEGGVYLDIKSSATIPLDEVVRSEDGFLLSHWGENGTGEEFEGWGTNSECAHVPGGEFQQWHIICVPGHPFLRAVIERVLQNIDSYRPWRHGVGQVGTLRTTGPRPYTLAIYPLLLKHAHRRVATARAVGLQYSIFGDQTTHRKLGKTYYRNNHSPVVRATGLLALPFAAYVALRPFLRRLRPKK